MKVYHGTDSRSAQDIIQSGIKLYLGAKYTDNAQGFYVTESKEFAVRRANMVATRARKKYNSTQIKPAVIEMEINLEAMAELNVKIFGKEDEGEWKEFVFKNRLGQEELDKRQISNTNHNLDMKYDIVMDETADARVSTLVEQFRTSYARGDNDFQRMACQIDISPNAVWAKQISFHSENALKLITSMRIIDLEE